MRGRSDGHTGVSNQKVNWGNPVMMMTGRNLHRMVGDVLEKKREPDELIELLHTAREVLCYEG